MDTSAPAPRRLCYFCKHFMFHNSTPGYSEVTPGDDFYIGCVKEKWHFDAHEDSHPKFALCISSAANCSSYEFDESVLVDMATERLTR